MSSKQNVIIPIIPVRNGENSAPPRPAHPMRDAIEGFFVQHRHRLVWVHAAAFVAFVTIIVLPLFLSEAPETSTPLTHFTTFANYVMWGLWFPLV